MAIANLNTYRAQSSSHTPFDDIHEALNQLTEKCAALELSLSSEKEKSAKLRSYLATKNQILTPPEDELGKLKSLIEDQTQLINQLYTENSDSVMELKRLTQNNEQLIAVNNKQKKRMIHLGRQIRENAREG